jgi:hypothetical protein
MGTEPISAADWGIVTLAGVAVLLLVELEKAVWRGLRRLGSVSGPNRQQSIR